jgi:hypothetical protein
MGGGAATTTTALTAVLAALSNYGDVGGDDGSDNPDNSNDGSAANASAGYNGRHRHRTAVTGWGIESHIEGSRSRDRPIVLGGSAEAIILAAREHNRHPRRPQPEWDDGTGNPKEDGGDGVHVMHHSPSPYHFMVEDYDNNDGAATSSSSAAADRYARFSCIKGGSSGYPAHNWAGAF